MLVKVVETEKYILKIYEDNLLEYYVKEGVVIDMSLALEVKKICALYRPNTKFYVFTEGSGFFNVTKEVREAGASKEFSKNMAAVALFTNNPSLLLLGELYNKINKPVVETKIFTNREKAHKWLRSKMEKDQIKQ